MRMRMFIMFLMVVGLVLAGCGGSDAPGTSTEQVDAALDVGTDTTDAAIESCVPDTCAAHGYSCGSMPDGCGGTAVCVSPWVDQGIPAGDPGCPKSYPALWTCATPTTTTQPLPTGTSACVREPGSDTRWCCR